MRVCTFTHSHLFLDGRFTNGAASVWPAESEVKQKNDMPVINSQSQSLIIQQILYITIKALTDVF